VTIHLLQHHAN